MKKHVVFIGAPGSGKGTQAKKLMDDFGFQHLSTGDLLRKEIGKHTDLGQEVKSVLDKGELVSDELMIKLLLANCCPEKESYIFDGYPRNKTQAISLEEDVLQGAELKAVYFSLNDELLVERLANRRICRECSSIYNLKTHPPAQAGICDQCGAKALYQREDDHEEVIRHRLGVFHSKVRLMLDYYSEKGLLIEIDGAMKVEAVYQQIIAGIEGKY